MDLKELLKKTRSYRRFMQMEKIELDELTDMLSEYGRKGIIP